jgi:hypothetical protein
VTIEGRVRFLQVTGLGDAAARIHHTRPLIVFVDKIKGVKAKEDLGPIIIRPVAPFEAVGLLARRGWRKIRKTRKT